MLDQTKVVLAGYGCWEPNVARNLAQVPRYPRCSVPRRRPRRISDKLVLIPNGTDTEMFHPNGTSGRLKAELGLEGKFVVIYAGTHGPQAKLASAISAAYSLRDRREIAFLFVEEGAEKPKLIEMCKELSLSNVQFVGQQLRQLLSRYLGIADAAIVHTRRDAFFEGYLPVKMFDYMPAGCPVILGANGEARCVLEQANAGIWVGPEDPEAMAGVVQALFDDPEKCRQLGRNGREYAVEHFSRSKLGKRLVDILIETVNATSGGGR